MRRGAGEAKPRGEKVSLRQRGHKNIAEVKKKGLGDLSSLSRGQVPAPSRHRSRGARPGSRRALEPASEKEYGRVARSKEWMGGEDQGEKRRLPRSRHASQNGKQDLLQDALSLPRPEPPSGCGRPTEIAVLRKEPTRDPVRPSPTETYSS